MRMYHVSYFKYIYICKRSPWCYTYVQNMPDAYVTPSD